MTQIELHKKIDELVLKNPDDVKKEEVFKLIPKDNGDGWQYFYTKADERWLDWLWGNGFLDKIKEKSSDTTRFGGQRFPELDYLVNMSEKVPDEVVEIMLKVEVSKEHFNPGVLNRFIWICNNLPSKELSRIIPKIKKENWVQLMNAFNSFGFEYERMFKILKDAEDYESILTLAETILTVRSKEEVRKDGHAGVSTGKSFYFNDLSHTKVFEYLVGVDSEYIERALALAIKTMSKVINLGGKADSEEIFPIRETFHLHDIDFFTLELDEKERLSHRDDVRNLVAVIKELAQKTIGSYDTDPYRAQELYKRYFVPLPDSRSMWRLKLFVMTLYPDYFKNELKEAFFRLFYVMDSGKSYYEIISGAEYERALQKGFSILSDDDKRKYISNVIESFVKKNKERKNDNENWHLQYGADLLSVIANHLNEKEKEQAKKAGFKINPDHEPEPSIKMTGFAGRIVSKGPISQEEFDKKPIDEILRLLQDDWTPEKLNEQNENKDFHNPRNAEGAGKLLQTGVVNRFSKFITNSELFFDKDDLDAHYTHEFLSGILNGIKKGMKPEDGNWQPVISLLKEIIKANLKNKERKEGFYDTWIANWQAVYYMIPDILQELLSEKDEQIAIGDFKKYRDDLFNVLGFLLKYPDPKPEDEKTESARSTTSTNDGSMTISDPYSIAINSVKGRAFQAFLMFVYQDGKELKKEDIKIREDVKSLYEEILKEENTRAIMFMHGHHLPTFFFRDEKWTKEVLIPQIFTSEKDEYLKLAGIEGYLTQTLYKEMFEDTDFKKLYEGWIELKNTKYPNQKHYKNIDDALATHMALAFIHFDIDVDKDKGFEDKLLEKFWEINNVNNQTRHHEFISFIGRSVFARDQAGNKWREENKIDKEKLVGFWDWILKNVTDPKVLNGFGFWINPNKEILADKIVVDRIAQTLKDSNGDIDWDYGLTKRLIAFAEIDPENTLSVIKSYLLDKNENLNSKRELPMFHLDNEIKEALEIIYNNGNVEIKQKVIDLINTLIEKGGSIFWSLKDIIQSEGE